ncbi:sialidase family protein [Actinomadura nitritigenes]|uniref:sialidase family protein n=1 Tax=Actinomadura nitritigenes TaxID=134602 RepID=UPI003D8EACF0
MTSTGKQDGDHGPGQGEVERPDAGRPGQAPPPPQWLAEQGPSGATPLLPEPAEQPPPFGEPLPEPEDDESDRTVSDIDISGMMRTQVFSTGNPGGGEGGGGEPADPPPLPPFPGAPAAAPAGPASGGPASGDPIGDQTILDASAWLGNTGRDDDEDEEADVTRVERPAASQQPPAAPQPPVQPPAPPAPPPFAQQPPAPQPPAPQPPAPFPYAQDVPAPPPAAPEPFPWAQEIPGNPHAALPPTPQATPQPAPPLPGPGRPGPAQPAHEPFPWAQEIPDNKPVLGGPEPFPYAQEIPGVPSQQLPGPQAAPLGPPVTPAPPTIDEPWRTEPKKKGAKRSKKPILIGVAGLAAVAVLAGGGYYFVSQSGGDDDGGSAAGVRLAGSLFAAGQGGHDGLDQRLTDVAAAGSTVVAVGAESGVTGSRPEFLVSSDGGRTYTSAEVKGTGGTPDDTPRLVGGGGRGWVAIGAGTAGPVLWTSQDGRSWTRQPDQAALPFGGHTRVKQVIGTGDGFMAIGASSKKGDFSDAEPAVWTSGDGASWAIKSGGQLGLPVRNGQLALVTAAASGNAVVVEAIHAPDPKKPARFRRTFRSEDGGSTWDTTEVPAPKGTHGLMVGGGPTGFLAIREINGPYGQAFTSKDGKTWTKAGQLKASGYRSVSTVLGDANGFAAIVVRGRDLLVSRSADGNTWQDAGSVPAQPGRTVRSSASAAGQSVVVGFQNGGGDQNAMLTVLDAKGAEVPVDLAKVPGAVRRDHTVTALGSDGGKTVAVGSAGGEAAAWVSGDGKTWTRAQGAGAAFSRPGGQRLLSVAAGRQGWLAVGFDRAAPHQPLVVTSSDGSGWQAADGADAFRPGRDQLATYATAAGPAGYVIVGEDGASAATWFSADLKTWERGRGVGNSGLNALPNSDRWLRSVAAGGFGFAAAGGLRDPAAKAATADRPAVWTSQDGKQWTLKQLPLPSGTTDGSLTQVGAQGNTIVAAGEGRTPSGTVALGYVSADGGRTWKAVQLPSPGGAKAVRVTALAATGAGFSAAGTAGDAGSADVVAWTSADGASWTVSTPSGKGLAGPGDQEITGLAAAGGTLLGVGGTADRDGQQPVLWSRPAK